MPAYRRLLERAAIKFKKIYRNCYLFWRFVGKTIEEKLNQNIGS